MEGSYTGMMNCDSSLNLSFLPRGSGSSKFEKFQASNYGFGFLVISLQPEAIKEPIKVTPLEQKDTPIT